jgi:hypothetical protein
MRALMRWMYLRMVPSSMTDALARASFIRSMRSAATHSRWLHMLPSENRAIFSGEPWSATAAGPVFSGATTISRSACISTHGHGAPRPLHITEINGMQLVLFDMQNRTVGTLFGSHEQDPGPPRHALRAAHDIRHVQLAVPSSNACRPAFVSCVGRVRKPSPTCSAPASTSAAHSLGELRTRLPSAPAALARVLSSRSRRSATSGAIAAPSATYSASLWNAAERGADRARRQVCLSLAAQPSVVRVWDVEWKQVKLAEEELLERRQAPCLGLLGSSICLGCLRPESGRKTTLT